MSCPLADCPKAGVVEMPHWRTHRASSTPASTCSLGRDAERVSRPRLIELKGVGRMSTRERALDRNVTGRTFASFSVAFIVAAIVAIGCSREEPTTPSGGTADYRQVALEFARSLAAREYPKAYAMMSQGYRQNRTLDELRVGFEAIVPRDWGAIGPIEVSQTMTSWPAKQPSDVGWAYVSIGGEVYSEAVMVVVTSENGEARIREVEFGRP